MYYMYGDEYMCINKNNKYSDVYIKSDKVCDIQVYGNSTYA